MADSIEVQMFKKLVGSALGAVGSKVGGEIGGLVLNYLGLGSQSSAEIAAELKQIESQVKDIDANLHKLINQTNYNFATKDFATYTAILQTASSDIDAYLSDTKQTDAQKKAEIKKYLLNTAKGFANLDVYLTAIDDAMSGKANAILGQPARPLLELFIDAYWDSLITSENLGKTYSKIVDAYQSSVLFQLRASSLSHSYHLANNDSVLAQKVIDTFTTRVVEQYKLMIKSMPELVALIGIDAPGLTISADSFSFEYPPASKKQSYLKLSGNLLGNSTTPHNVTMTRAGKIGKADAYSMSYDYFYQGIRGKTRILIDSVSFGARTIDHYAQIDAIIATMVNKVPASGPTPLEIIPTKTQNKYMLRASDDKQLGLSPYSDAGILVTFRKENTSDAGQIVSFDGLQTVPQAFKDPDNAYVRAWSKAYSPKDGNLGQWAKGFRVRYRLIFVNRFGESSKSQWISASKWNQDANGYFDGNGKYYMPQIQISPEEAGLAESFRLFRQFENHSEEEISYSLTAASSATKPPILDDLNP